MGRVRVLYNAREYGMRMLNSNSLSFAVLKFVSKSSTLRNAAARAGEPRNDFIVYIYYVGYVTIICHITNIMRTYFTYVEYVIPLRV